MSIRLLMKSTSGGPVSKASHPNTILICYSALVLFVYSVFGLVLFAYSDFGMVITFSLPRPILYLISLLLILSKILQALRKLLGRLAKAQALLASS